MTQPNLQTLKGFRDFLPKQMRARNLVRKIISETFELFGYEPLSTPTLEYASILLNKYGEEADRLVYQFKDNGDRQVGMRYDLTVPTARVMSMYTNEIKLPFKRYQIDPAWRAENTQKGRYREFIQADIDFFGSISPASDAEIATVVATVLPKLGLKNFKININSRQVLYQILEDAQIKDNKNYILQTIDKLDKIGEDGVQKELNKKGLSDSQVSAIFVAIKSAKPDANLQQVYDAILRMGVDPSQVVFNPTIVRGLDYYTGFVFETIIPEANIGTVAAGGRYDQLIKSLGGPDVPAVGCALGFERLLDCLEIFNLLPGKNYPAKFILLNVDESLQADYLSLASRLRSKGISVIFYPEVQSIAKQLKYADFQNIPLAIILGSQEKAQNKLTLKNLSTQTQQLVSEKELYLL